MIKSRQLTRTCVILVEDLSKLKQQEVLIRNDPLLSEQNSKCVRLKSQIVSQRKIHHYLEHELTEFCNQEEQSKVLVMYFLEIW